MEYTRASKIRRIFAYLLDSLFIFLLIFIWFVIFMLSNSLLHPLDNINKLLILIPMFFLILSTWIYFLFKDSMFSGKSIGKFILKIKVVDINSGQSCSRKQSFLRNILLVIPLISLIEIISFLFTSDARRIGDKMAKTRVVYAKDTKDVKKSKKGDYILIFVIFILIISPILIMDIIGYEYKSKNLIYNIKLIPDNKGSNIEKDLGIIENRIGLEGYYSEGKIETLNEEKIIVLKTYKDLFENKDLLNELIKEANFEAKIGDEVAFSNGDDDITYVARTGDQSGIYSCNTYQDGEVCSFRFAMSLSEKAAQRHSEITNKLSINYTNPEYLDKKLDLYLDGKLVDSLYIGKDLKGSAITQIAISGSGVGNTRSEAYDDAIKNMNKLQAILITGSLSSDYEIVEN